MKQTESNNLIAEFMGYINTTPTDKDFNIFENNEGKMLESMSMKYHSSWDWLMPVVEKIESFETDNYWSEVSKASCNEDYNSNEWSCTSFGIEKGHTCITVHSVVRPEMQRNYKQFTSLKYDKGLKIEYTYYSIIKFIEWYNELKKL